MSNENISTTISNQNGEKVVSIDIKQNLTQMNAEDIKNELIDSINSFDNLQINIRNIEGIDLSVIQILHAFRITAKELNKKVEFNVNLSDDVKTIVLDAGFNDKLCLEQ